MDYDSARHHFESLQTAKKKDEAKIAKVRAGGRAGGVFWEVQREPRRSRPSALRSPRPSAALVLTAPLAAAVSPLVRAVQP